MLWQVIKQSALDIWDEILFLMLFSLIWFLGTGLIIPWPFVTFGLFFTAYDIGLGKGIKFTTLFVHGRRMWKQAYIWGGINLGALIIVWTNLNFYASFEAPWAAFVRVLFVALAIFWAILQLVVLPLYPRLAEPNFRLALRNAAIVVGRYPLATLILVITVILLGLLSALFPPFAFLAAPAIFAVVANRLVGEIIGRELRQKV